MSNPTPMSLILQVSRIRYLVDNDPSTQEAHYPRDFLNDSTETDGAFKTQFAADGSSIPLWIPAVFHDPHRCPCTSMRPGQTAHRCAVNVAALHALVLDVDGTADTELAFTVWGDYDFVLYTTRSHTPESPSYRVVLPYSRPATPGEHAATWAWAEERMGKTIDSACKDPNRAYYVPSHAPGIPPESHHNTGKLVEPLPQSADYRAPTARAKEVDVGDFLHVKTTDFGLATLERIELELWEAPHKARAKPMYAAGALLGEWVAQGEINPLEAQDMLADVGQRWMLDGSKHPHAADAANGFSKGLAVETAVSLLKKMKGQSVTASSIAADAPHSDVEASDEQAAAAHASDPSLAVLSRGADSKLYIASLLAAGVQDAGLLTGLLMRHTRIIGISINAVNARRSVIASITAFTRAQTRAAAAAAKQAQRAQSTAAVGGGGLRLTAAARPESTFGNVVRALSQQPFDRMFWMDSFKRRVMVETPVTDGEPALPAKPLTDELTREIRVQLDVLDIHPTLLDTREAVYARAAEDRRNPIVDWFDAQSWDGVERFADEARALFGPGADAAEDDYNARCLEWWMMSAVVRARNPGAKADSMLVLYAADGGEGKTELLRALCPHEDWFNPAPVSQDEKRSIMVLPNYLIHEMAEMPTWKNHVEYMTFIDRRRDTGVRMHGKEIEDTPRQCVFFGNTNVKLYLVDRSSENRRFLTVEVRSGRIDLARVKAVAPQLWAEADAKLEAGKQYWPTPEQQTEIGLRNQNYLADDSVEDAVYQTISKSTLTVWPSNALLEQVSVSCGHASHPNGKSIGQAMVRFGWEKDRSATSRGWKWNPANASKKHAVPPKASAPITNVPLVSAFPHAPVNAK